MYSLVLAKWTLTRAIFNVDVDVNVCIISNLEIQQHVWQDVDQIEGRFVQMCAEQSRVKFGCINLMLDLSDLVLHLMQLPISI